MLDYLNTARHFAQIIKMDEGDNDALHHLGSFLALWTCIVHSITPYKHPKYYLRLSVVSRGNDERWMALIVSHLWGSEWKEALNLEDVEIGLALQYAERFRGR